MRHPPSSLVVWLAIVILFQAAVANAVRYEITGHYAEIRPNDVEGNDTNYDTQAEKIQSKISELIDDDNLVFVLNRFETHGKEVNFPSVIFYGYFTSETNLGRSDIIDRFEQADDAELYFLGEIDELPVITRRLPHEEKNQLDGSLCNNGVMLKNQTCVCAPFVSGEKCDQWMCMNHGVNDPVNQGRCGCPPGFTSAHCEFGGCQPAVESAFQFYDRTFILVFSQKSSMGWELNLLIKNLDNVFTTIYERTGQSIFSYIFAGFRQSNLAFYLESNYFETKGQFITYLKGIVTGNGDDRQPVMRSIYEAQKVSAKMYAMSTMFVFTDSLDSNDTDVQNLYASNPYTQYVAKTITWRNKPTIFLSQTSPSDTSDSGFTVLQNFVTATHGDFIVANKSAEMNTIITQMLPVFYQTENIHVKFGATTVDAFEVESDDPTQTVYALISVTQQTTLPGLASEGGGTLPVAISGQQFTLYNFTQTASIKANLGDTPYNLRLFVISADTILVSNANDRNADGGAATAFNQIGENTFVASTLTNTITNVTQDIVDLTNGKTPLTPQRLATNRNSSCSWPFIIMRSEPIYNSGGPYVNKIVIIYQPNNVTFTRVIPGFSISADGHADLPFECLNSGSRTGPSSCACTSHWEGANCEIPLCAYGGTPNQFPSPDEGPCECPVGYGGDFCDQLSCFQPKPDPKFSFKNRTIALIVQDSLTMNWTSADIASGINDMILQMNGTGMFTNFLLTTFHLKENVLGYVESFNQTTNFGMDTDFLRAVNNINYSSAELGNPLALDAMRYAIDTGFVYYKSSVMLFTDSAPNSTYGDSVYTQLADVAIELELEISIILMPPNNDRAACPTQNDLNIYYKLAKETGGNFLNLCQMYAGNYDNVIKKYLSVYGPSHLSIQTLNAFESPLPASLTFFIENSTTSYYAYINSESIENYTAIITNLDDQSQSAPLTSIAGLPFVSIFQLPQLQTNKNGYSIQFTSGEANPNYTTHFRTVIRSPLNVFSAFANNPEIDYDFASPIWSTPINMVAHISTVLQSAPPSVQILGTDAFGNATKIYDATSTDRAGCTYEYYFLDKFYCPNRDDSLYVTATFQTPEAIITRSKRLYCYLQEGLCANGGEPINGECGCNPVEADGRFCEHVRCHNGATNINNICHCAQGYTGTNCQDMNCTDGYNYLVADDDYAQSFEQITIVVETSDSMQGVRDKLLSTVPRFITAISKNLQDTQRHYSLILFDDTSVRRAMTTSDPDAFNFKFSQLIQQDNFKNAPVRTMEAIDAAHSMRVRNWHQIFVFTTSNHFDSGDVGKQQIFRTQVNVINVFTSDMPSLSNDSELLYVTRQSNGRIIPIQNDQGQFDRLFTVLISMVQEMGLLFEDGREKCDDNGINYSSSVETNAKSVIFYVISSGSINVSSTWLRGPNQTDIPFATNGMIIFSNEATMIISIDLSSQSMPWGLYEIHPVMKSGSCYIQARIISDFKVRVGFTSDPTKDHVKNLPFSGIGTSSSLYTTAYYNGGFYDYPDLFDCWTSDTTYPWVGRNNTPLSLYNITRDSETCAILAESPIQFNTSFSFYQCAVTGKDSSKNMYQRAFFYKTLSSADSARCENGQVDQFGECNCDPQHWGDFCDQRVCQNGGTPTRAICQCINGFYGDYCEQKVPAEYNGTTQAIVTIPTTTTVASSPASSPAQPTSASQAPSSMSTSPTLNPTGTTVPGCTPIACNSSAVKYLVSHMIDATDHAYMTTTLQPIISQLAGDVLAGQSRFTIGGASFNYHPYPNNVTTQSDVATAIQYIVNLNVTNETEILFYSDIRGFLNNTISAYDYATETPPIFIFYLNRFPLDFDTSSVPRGIGELTARGYKVLAVNMNPDDTNMTRIMNEYIGECETMTFTNQNDLVTWIKQRMCTYKWNNTVYTTTPPPTTVTTPMQTMQTSAGSATGSTASAQTSPLSTLSVTSGSPTTTAPSCIPTDCDINQVHYLVSHLVDGTSVDFMRNTLQPLVSQFGDDLLETMGNSRFVIGAANANYTYYPSNVTRSGNISTAFDAIIGAMDQNSHDIHLANVITQFRTSPVEAFDSQTETPPIFIFYLNTLPSDDGTHGAFINATNTLSRLGYTILGVNMDPSNTNLNSNMTTFFGTCSVKTFTNNDDVVAWIKKRLCTIKPNNNPYTTTPSVATSSNSLGTATAVPTSISTGSPPTTAPSCIPVDCDSAQVHYLISHLLDATSTSYLSSTLQPLVQQLASDVLERTGNTRFIIGGANKDYIPYESNVTQASDISSAIQNIIDRSDSSANSIYLANVITQFRTSPVEAFDSQTETPPIFIFYLNNLPVDSSTSVAFINATNTLSQLGYSILGVNMNPINPDLQSNMTTFFGPCSVKTFTSNDDVVAWIKQRMCTIKPNNTIYTTTPVVTTSQPSPTTSTKLPTTSTLLVTTTSLQTTTLLPISIPSTSESTSLATTVTTQGPNSTEVHTTTQPTTTKSAQTSVSSTSPPSTLPLSCDPRYGKYLINAFIDNTKSDSNLISQKAGGTLLDLYDYVIAGNDQNSRVVIGGAIDSYIPTNQNCTSASGRSCIQNGIKILEDSRNVFDFAFNFTGSTQQFLNSDAAKFGDDEKPPIIIWFLSILPNDGLAGLKYSLNLAQAAGYTVLGIATDSDTPLMKAALDQALDQNATFLYTNPQDTAYWIRKKLCDIKPAPPPAGTTLTPPTTSQPASTQLPITKMPITANPPTCEYNKNRYMIAHFIDASGAKGNDITSKKMNSLLPMLGQTLFGSGTRFVIGGMGRDYINNGANCTDEKSIADALTAITDGQIDPPDFDMNITRSVRTFANRKVSFYDIDAEANPVAILWLANMPDDVVSGLNFAKSDFDGLEYNVIVINMDPTNSWIRNIAEQAWPLEQVWNYYSNEDVVRWIQYKLCQIKNGGFTFTPPITPTAPSTQPLVRHDPYYIAHFMDCGSSLYYYYDIFLTYLGNILFSNQSGTRFILGGMNQTSYSYYNANVTSLSQIKPAKQNLFDQCHDLNYKINPAVQQFANTDLIHYDEKNEAPPVALLALGKKNLDSLLGLHTGIQKLRSLNFVVIAIDFSNDEDMNETLTEELGPTNFTTFTDYYNTSLWVVHYLCTYVKDCGALVTGTPATTPVQTTISTLTPPTGATSPSQAPSASTSNSQPATSPTSPTIPTGLSSSTVPISSPASSSPQGSSSAPVTNAVSSSKLTTLPQTSSISTSTHSQLGSTNPGASSTNAAVTSTVGATTSTLPKSSSVPLISTSTLGPQSSSFQNPSSTSQTTKQLTTSTENTVTPSSIPLTSFSKPITSEIPSTSNALTSSSLIPLTSQTNSPSSSSPQTTSRPISLSTQVTSSISQTVSSQQPSSSSPLPPGSSSTNPTSSLPTSTLPSTSPSQSTVPQQTTTPFTPTTTQPPTTPCKDVSNLDVYVAHLMDVSDLDSEFMATEFPPFANALGLNMLTNSSRRRFVFAGLSGNVAVPYDKNVTSPNDIGDAINNLTKGGTTISLGSAVASFIDDKSISTASSAEMPGIAILSLYWTTADGSIGCSSARSELESNNFIVLGVSFGSGSNNLLANCVGSENFFKYDPNNPDINRAVNWVIDRVCRSKG